MSVALAIPIPAPVYSLGQNEYQAAIQRCCKEAFAAQRYPIKQLAEAANVNIKTAKNWWEGRATPQGLQLLRLIAMVPQFQAEFRRLTNLAVTNDPRVERALNDLVHTYLRAQGTKATP